jgi:ABC-type glutathione transport system ATPase component
MRLGFAVAINVDPDVLLVDEVLAVGDEGFTHKCLDKFAEFRRRGKTILLVTHALNLVERFCDEALWLDAGEVRAAGDPRRVVSAYIADVTKGEERELAAGDRKAPAEAEHAAEATVVAPVPDAETPAPDALPADMSQAAEGRWGTREVEIAAVELVGEDGRPGHIFQSGERVSIRMNVRAAQPVRDFVLGVGIFNAEGVCCWHEHRLEELEAEEFVGEAWSRSTSTARSRGRLLQTRRRVASA